MFLLNGHLVISLHKETTLWFSFKRWLSMEGCHPGLNSELPVPCLGSLMDLMVTFLRPSRYLHSENQEAVHWQSCPEEPRLHQHWTAGRAEDHGGQHRRSAPAGGSALRCLKAVWALRRVVPVPKAMGACLGYGVPWRCQALSSTLSLHLSDEMTLQSC